MASTLQFKVFDVDGEYLASFRYVEDAAILVAAKEDGTTIRNGHSKRTIVWTEGVDGSASRSYSVVADIVHGRI